MERSGSNPRSRSLARTVFIFVLREPEPDGGGWGGLGGVTRFRVSANPLRVSTPPIRIE